MKKCNSRPPSNKDYYKESANTISKTDDSEDLNILTMSQDEKVQLIMKLIDFHQGTMDLVYTIQVEFVFLFWEL